MPDSARSYESIVTQAAFGWGPDSESYAVADGTLRRAGVPELLAEVEELREDRDLARRYEREEAQRGDSFEAEVERLRKALRLIESGAFTRRLTDTIREADPIEKAKMIAGAALRGDDEQLALYADALDAS